MCVRQTKQLAAGLSDSDARLLASRLSISQGNDEAFRHLPKKLAAAFFPIHFLRMHLALLRLRDFRNYPRLDTDFAPGFHLLLGDNAQGKTNILEAVYLMATLRSFRGVGGAQMVRHGQKGYFVGGNVTGQDGHEIKMYWSVRERNLSLDGRPGRKLGDFLGTLR